MVVPSMFTVAPNGSTKRAIESGTLPLDLTHFRVMGRVAADEEQANAMVCAGIKNLRYSIGLVLVMRYQRPK